MPWNSLKHIELLLERLNDEFLNELTKKVKYGTKCQQNIEIRNAQNSNDPRVLKTRFEDYPCYRDARFEKNYSANVYFNFIICQGPDPGDPKSVENYIQNTFFNKNFQKIKKLLICGEPGEGAQFYDYFSQDAHYGIYKLAIEVTVESISLMGRKLTITNSATNEVRVIESIQIVKMKDHGIAELSDKDISNLEIFLIDENQFPSTNTQISVDTVAHCAAGLGRSPTIMLSYILYKKFSYIFTGENKEITEKIINELDKFREVRPAAVQKPEQLIQAIKFALHYKKNRIIKNLDSFNLPTVCMIGCFDTKAIAYKFIRQQILERGLSVLTIDTGVFESNPDFIVDYTAEDVLNRSKIDFNIKELRSKNDRSFAVSLIKQCVPSMVLDLYTESFFDAIIGLGGTNGTEIVTKAMRKLPREIPKVCISTVAQHDNYIYTKDSSIVLINSVTDISEIHQISKIIYQNAVGCIVGMLRLPKKSPADLDFLEKDKLKNPLKTIGITMFGNTTPCVMRCEKFYTQKNYEVLVFHAVGTGGQIMEKLVEEGRVDGVCDITTTELADEIGGGVFSAGPKRLSAAGEKGIPHLIIPGCLDMINFESYEKAIIKFPNRILHKCNKHVTVMRTTVEENFRMGKIIAFWANIAAKKGSPIAILIPKLGLSMFDHPDNDFKWYDKYANEMLFASIKKHCIKSVPIIEANYHINDIRFSEIVCSTMIELIERKNLTAHFSNEDVVLINGKNKIRIDDDSNKDITNKISFWDTFEPVNSVTENLKLNLSKSFNSKVIYGKS